MSSVWSFAILWGFESLAAGARVQKKKRKTRRASSMANRANSPRNFVHFLPLARVPRHPASGKGKPDNFGRSVPKIVGFNDLK